MPSAKWKQRKEAVDLYFRQNVKASGFAAFFAFFRMLFGTRPPADKQIDQWVKDAEAEVRKVAKRRLDVDDTQIRRKFEVRSPVQGARWFKGKDKRARSSKIRLTQVYLLDHYLACYRATYDLAEQAIMDEETEEFPFQEITGFGTRMVSTESVELEKGDKFVGDSKLDGDDERFAITFREFVVHTRSGVFTKVPFVVGRVVRDEEMEDLDDEGEKTVISLRKQLSDYKRPEWEKNAKATGGAKGYGPVI